MQRKHFVSLSVFQIMAMFRRGIFYFFLSIYLREFLGVSNTIMTLFATLPMIANIVAQTSVWGRISDKYKKRRLLIISGEIIAALGYLIVYWIHKGFVTGNTYQAAAFTIIIGFTIIEFFWSSSNLGWTALIADLTKETDRSKIMGRLQFVGGIGNILGVTASGFFYKGGIGFSNGPLFYISSGIMIFSVFALFLIPESYADLETPQESQLEESTKDLEQIELRDTENKQKKKWDWRLLVWLLGVLAIVNIGGNSITTFVQLYVRLDETFGITNIAAKDQIVAQLRNTSSIAIIIAGLVVGFFTSRFGDHNILLVGFILALSATLTLPLANHVAFVFLYMVLWGATRVFVQTTSYAMVTKIVPLEHRGKMMGYYNATFYLSWGLGGTILTGPIADAIEFSQIITIMIYTALAMAIIVLVIFLIIRKYTIIDKKKIFGIPTIVLLLAGLSLAIIYGMEPLSRLLINGGNSEAYAYKTTFFIATGAVFIGIITYIVLRPLNFKLFNHKNNTMDTSK